MANGVLRVLDVLGAGEVPAMPGAVGMPGAKGSLAQQLRGMLGMAKILGMLGTTEELGILGVAKVLGMLGIGATSAASLHASLVVIIENPSGQLFAPEQPAMNWPS